MPIGVPLLPQVPDPPRHDPVALAEVMAEKIVTGKGEIKTLAKVPASDYDRRIFQRITGESVEAFNARLSSKLGEISDDVLEVIKRKLAGDEFKTSELAFLFSVMHDKRLSMDGRSQVTNASINVQVNNYGSSIPKADLIAMLEGRKPAVITEKAG